MFTFESVKASFIESFNVLKLESIKLLALVSLNTLFFVYRSLMYAWFLPLALLVGLVLDAHSLIAAFYLTVLVKAARPSMELKRTVYWQQPVFADWIIFLGVFAFLQVPFFFTESSSFLTVCYDLMLKLFFLSGPAWLPGTAVLGLLLVFLSPLIILWVLFMLDAQIGFWQYVKACGRAVTMLMYNYPFFLVVYAVLRIVLSLGYLISMPLVSWLPQLAFLGWFILLGFIIPYWVCFITNFYVKRLHEQFSLYYRK